MDKCCPPLLPMLLLTGLSDLHASTDVTRPKCAVSDLKYTNATSSTDAIHPVCVTHISAMTSFKKCLFLTLTPSSQSLFDSVGNNLILEFVPPNF